MLARSLAKRFKLCSVRPAVQLFPSVVQPGCTPATLSENHSCVHKCSSVSISKQSRNYCTSWEGEEQEGYGDEDMEIRQGAGRGPRSLNEVRLLGNCGRDPQIMTSRAGKEYAILSIATNDGGPNGPPNTNWHTVLCFIPGTVNYIANNIQKGNRLMIGGKITYQVNFDEQSQTRTQRTSIIADQVINCSPRQI